MKSMLIWHEDLFRSKINLPRLSENKVFNAQRWSRFRGQNGGLAKMDSGLDYAANFFSLACVA